ncbi:twin-arginine translocase TatA/TatE family subunit [Thalassobaculum litoreum]|uniref:Sec-independent protein translocase protein TatA n=1 Tax=Thalassobaculum litoreum DSM 18839 TaxID=1123362 RepID=A0A8G2EWY2_9PROT|nr:twin-arginine translocase TatA/TatE family subunit [Thalassobaculum litoreum]SDF16637.1 sec-independent protein translocase protein TatA [Thalassobaculum litoreum DSM 18839]
MGSFSIWHWLVVLAVVLLLFGGKGKISSLMGDFGKGLKNFKQGMKSEEDEAEQANKSVANESDEQQDVNKNTNQTVKS